VGLFGESRAKAILRRGQIAEEQGEAAVLSNFSGSRLRDHTNRLSRSRLRLPAEQGIMGRMLPGLSELPAC